MHTYAALAPPSEWEGTTTQPSIIICQYPIFRPSFFSRHINEEVLVGCKGM